MKPLNGSNKLMELNVIMRIKKLKTQMENQNLYHFELGQVHEGGDM